MVRTTRVLSTLLSIVAKSESHDKFKVTATSVPYLAALVSVVEEVRTRCTIKTRISVLPANTAAAAGETDPSTSLLGHSSIGHPSSPFPQSISSASIADSAGANLSNAQAGSRTLKPWDSSYLNRTRNITGMSAIISIPPYDRCSQWMDVGTTIRRIFPKPPSTLTYLQPVKPTIPIVVTPQILLEPQQMLQVRHMLSISSRLHRQSFERNH